MFDTTDATVAMLTSSRADVRLRSQEANGFNTRVFCLKGIVSPVARI